MAKYAGETERLWLQPLSIDDHLNDFHQIMSDAKAISFSYVFYPQTLQA
jgi:ribosomal-protein-alanine N-acetyltransferase